MSVYTELFKDELLTALTIPFHESFVLPTMLAFGDYSTWQIFAVSLVAAMLGYAISFAVGKWIVREPWFARQLEGQASYGKASHIAERYAWWLLAFSGLGVAWAFLPFIAGFLNMSSKCALLACAVGQSIYLYSLIY